MASPIRDGIGSQLSEKPPVGKLNRHIQKYIHGWTGREVWTDGRDYIAGAGGHA
jgi:hypothetical protein